MRSSIMFAPRLIAFSLSAACLNCRRVRRAHGLSDCDGELLTNISNSRPVVVILRGSKALTKLVNLNRRQPTLVRQVQDEQRALFKQMRVEAHESHERVRRCALVQFSSPILRVRFTPTPSQERAA